MQATTRPRKRVACVTHMLIGCGTRLVAVNLCPSVWPLRDLGNFVLT